MNQPGTIRTQLTVLLLACLLSGAVVACGGSLTTQASSPDDALGTQGTPGSDPGEARLQPVASSPSATTTLSAPEGAVTTSPEPTLPAVPADTPPAADLAPTRAEPTQEQLPTTAPPPIPEPTRVSTTTITSPTSPTTTSAVETTLAQADLPTTTAPGPIPEPVNVIDLRDVFTPVVETHWNDIKPDRWSIPLEVQVGTHLVSEEWDLHNYVVGIEKRDFPAQIINGVRYESRFIYTCPVVPWVENPHIGTYHLAGESPDGRYRFQVEPHAHVEPGC